MKKTFHFVLFFSLLILTGCLQAQIKVVALHPLMADLARQVGGDHVEVISLMTERDDPHHFQPTPAKINQTRGASLYLASGMGLETYLKKLRDTLGDSARVIEIGKSLPARKLPCPHHDHHEGHHHHGAIDPHWWHRVSNMQRATDIVAEIFAKADAKHSTIYQENARIYQKKLSRLHSWIRREVIKIPKEDRKLATAHISLGYFCDAYGFEAIAIQGINKEEQPSATELAEILHLIREEKIKAIFPEQRSNPKALKTIATETGIRIGGTLITDGSTSYTKMMRHNVNTIVKALAPTP